MWGRVSCEEGWQCDRGFAICRKVVWQGIQQVYCNDISRVFAIVATGDLTGTTNLAGDGRDEWSRHDPWPPPLRAPGTSARRGPDGPASRRAHPVEPHHSRVARLAPVDCRVRPCVGAPTAGRDCLRGIVAGGNHRVPVRGPGTVRPEGARRSATGRVCPGRASGVAARVAGIRGQWQSAGFGSTFICVGHCASVRHRGSGRGAAALSPGVLASFRCRADAYRPDMRRPLGGVAGSAGRRSASARGARSGIVRPAGSDRKEVP